MTKTVINQNFQGDGGGPEGPEGPPGPRGEQGPASIQIQSVTTIDANANAYIVNAGSSVDVALEFYIPRGNKGEQGPASIQIGNVFTLPANANAYVTNNGTSGAMILEFGLPSGADGTTISGAASTVKDSNLTPNLVVCSNSLGKLATTDVPVSVLNYVGNLRSSAQVQIDQKANVVVGAASTIVSSNLNAGYILVSSIAGKVAVSNVGSANLQYIKTLFNICRIYLV